MDFYVDIAVAILLRLLRDKRERSKYLLALAKVYNTIGLTFVPNHKMWAPDEKQVTQ